MNRARLPFPINSWLSETKITVTENLPFANDLQILELIYSTSSLSRGPTGLAREIVSHLFAIYLLVLYLSAGTHTVLLIDYVFHRKICW